MGAATAAHVTDEYLERILRGVAANNPEFFRYFGVPQPCELLQFGGLPKEVSQVEVSQEVFRKWLDRWAAKQAIAYWYHHTGKILSSNGGVFVHWIINGSADGYENFFEAIREMRLKTDWVKQGALDFKKQFKYLRGISCDETLATFVFSYHESAAVWCGVFEDFRKALRYSRLPIFRVSEKDGIYAFTSPPPHCFQARHNPCGADRGAAEGSSLTP